MIIPRKWQLVAEWSRNFTRQLYEICKEDDQITLEGIKRSVYNLSSNRILKNSENIIRHLSCLCGVTVNKQNESLILKQAQAVFGHIDCLHRCFRPIEPAKICSDGISEAVIVSAWEVHTQKGRKHLFVCKIIYGPGSQAKFKIIVPVEVFSRIVNKSRGLGIKAYRISSRPRLYDIIGCGFRCLVKEKPNQKSNLLLALSEFRFLPISQSIAKYNRSIYFARKREILPCPKGKSIDCCRCGIGKEKCQYAWKSNNVIIGKNCPLCLRSEEWFDLNLSEKMCISCWYQRHTRTKGYLIKPKLDSTFIYNEGEEE